MSKRGHRTTIERILLAITALFVLGGFMALGFSKDIPGENRAQIIFISSLGILACLAGLLLVGVFWTRLRRWTWQRAMATWERSCRTGMAPKFTVPDALAEKELQKLAIQTYSRIGYYVASVAGPGAYLQLINPDGRVELLVCQQHPEPINLPHVYSLELEMKRTKAVRAFFWAPAGFTEESIDWAVHRRIILADPLEIGRLVDCARSKGSRVLEHRD